MLAYKPICTKEITDGFIVTRSILFSAVEKFAPHCEGRILKVTECLREVLYR